MAESLPQTVRSVAGGNGRFNPWTGDGVRKKTERVSSAPNELLDQLQITTLKQTQGFHSPLENKTRSGRPKWTSTATCISFLVFALYFFIPFEKTPLPWLGTSSQYLRSCIHRFLRPTPTPSGGMSLSSAVPPVVTLAPFTFQPLPLGSIRPLGWIDDQMNLMSSGLAGHEYEFYHIVQHSPWLGGHSEYSSLNEGLPYWFNGLVPLAYGLNDSRLITQVQDASDYVINHQQSDGWLGPEAVADRDLWGRFPFMLGLMQQVEAEPARANKIIPAMNSYVTLMHSMLIENTGFGQIWGRVRYPDMIITLQWMYENHRGKNADLLIETMHLLQQRGLDWTSYWTESNFVFEDLDLVQPPIQDPSPDFPFTHGVNAVQGLKTGAVLHRFNKNESLIQTSRDAVNWTFTFHGDSAGSVIGDERESGLGSNRGSELCTAVETMYSLSYLYQAFGDKDYADRCERAAFNALPVSITGDHWARQYLALANEPFANELSGQTPFWNVGQYGILYGLEPNYPCCTVNMPQGLPKYLSASYVRVGKNGIGHALLGPAEVSTTTIAGTKVTISCRTTYPFGSVLSYSITASAAFTISLRVPGWANPRASSVEINGNGAENPVEPDASSGMTSVVLPAGTSKLIYKLGASIRTEPRGNNSVSIYHGSLLYALDVGQTVTTLPANLYNISSNYPSADGAPNIPSQAKDFAFANTRPWNIAIDPSSLVYHASADNTSATTLKNPIFDYEAPPSYITGKGCQINWILDRGVPAALPKLAEGAVWQCTGNVTDVILRPYGSLKIHMAELPIVDLSKQNPVNSTGQKGTEKKPRWVAEGLSRMFEA